MKKIKNIFRSRSKSRGSSGSAGSAAPEFDETEIKAMPTIHQAVINGDLEKVRKLMKTELEATDSSQRTPLYIACQMQEWDIVSMLLDAKCKLDQPDKNNITPLMKALEAKSSRASLFGIAQANQFVSYGCNILRVSNENRSCFHYLAMSKCADRAAVFTALLNSQKNVKVRRRIMDLSDKDKLTALHLAVMADNVDVCRSLISNNANVNLVDTQGRTPLMLSCSSGNEEICKAILAANPELHQKDSKGRSALTLARESSTQKCVPLIEEYGRSHPQMASSSEQSQSWEDVTGEEESDEAEEVEEEEESATQPPEETNSSIHIKARAPDPPVKQSEKKVVHIEPEMVKGKNDHDDVSSSSEEPVLGGTVRFKDQAGSPRPKLPVTNEASSPPAAVTVVKPVNSASSPRTGSSKGTSSSLLKQLTKSNDSNDDLAEPEFNLSGSGDQRSSLNRSVGLNSGNRLGHSYDVTSDVVKTSLDSVTSGMTTEWDSATEQSGAYAVPHHHARSNDRDIPKTPDDDDWSEGPAAFPVNTPMPLSITIETPTAAVKKNDGIVSIQKAGGDQQLTSLVAESVRRVIAGVGDDTTQPDKKAADFVQVINNKSGSASNMWDIESDLSEVALSGAHQTNNNKPLQQSQDDLILQNSRPGYMPSLTSVSQASSRWDTDELSQELGASGNQVLSPSRQLPKRRDDDTDVSDDVNDDDDDGSNVASEMGKYLEGSLVGEGGNWLGPAAKQDKSHLPPLRETAFSPIKKEIIIVAETEPISRSRRSSSSSVGQQNPSDWLGIEVADVSLNEQNRRKGSPNSIVAVAELVNASNSNRGEALAGASEISMPASPAFSGLGLMATQVVEGRAMSYSATMDNDADSIHPIESASSSKPSTTKTSPRIHSHHLNDPTPSVKQQPRVSPSFPTPKDDDFHSNDDDDGELGDIQPMIDNMFALSGSITDTYQLTKVQDAIRQLSTRTHADERKITGLQTENKMLRSDVTLLEQKIESVNLAKSNAERKCAQLELKISALEAEQVADARKSSSANERLRVQLQEAELKIANLQDEIKKLERERNQYEAKIISLEGMLKQVEGERDFAKQQHSLQQQQLMTVSTSSRDELRTEIARLMEENSKLNTRLDDATRSQKRAESELDVTRGELTTTKATIRINEQRIEEAHRLNETHIKRLNEDLIKKDAEIAKLGENNRNLTTQLETSQNKAMRLENDLVSSNRTVSERAQQLQMVQDEVRLVRVEANTERDHARKLELKNESLEQRLLDTERRLAELQRQLDESNHALTIANRRAGTTEMYTTGPSPLDTRSLSLMEMRCHELLENKARLTEDLVRMEAAKKSAEQEVKHITTRLADAEKRTATAEINLETAQRALEDANRKVDRADDDNRRAQTELAERNSEVDRLRRELAAFHEAASDLVGRSTTTATVSELKTRLKILEDELKTREIELNETKSKFELREQLTAAEMNKLKTHAEEARGLWEQEVKTKAGVGQLLMEAERRRDFAENELLLAKNESRRLEDQLRLGERRLEDERGHVAECETKLAKTKAKLSEMKVKLVGAQGYDEKLADLSRQLDQQRIAYDERITLLKKQIEDARREVEAERAVRDRIENDRRNLEVRIARVSSLESQVAELMRQKAIIDTDFAQYRDTIARTHVERSVMECKLQEIEAKYRAELDARIAQFHLSLVDLDRERDHTDEVRLANEQSKAALYDLEKSQLVEELQRVRSAYSSLVTGTSVETQFETQQQTQTQQNQMPITSTPISASEAPTVVMSPNNNDTAQACRRLVFDRLQPVLGNEHLSKILTSQLQINRRNQHHGNSSSTSLVTSRLLNQSTGRFSTGPLQRGSLLSASFHYAIPTAPFTSRRDFSIESLRAQLDRAVAVGLGSRSFTAGHSMI